MVKYTYTDQRLIRSLNNIKKSLNVFQEVSVLFKIELIICKSQAKSLQLGLKMYKLQTKDNIQDS
jgi:hypothetical protein